MKSDAKLSIILPVYNVEEYLAPCLSSLFSQDLDNMEIIAVNDGSTDGSLCILEEYRQRGTKDLQLCSIPNHGVSYARNYGLKKSRGEYVWFVDSDDLLPEGACRRIYEKAAALDADLVLFVNEELDTQTGNKKVRELSAFPADPSPGYSLHNDPRSLIHVPAYGWARVLRRSLAERMPFPEGIRFEDVPFSYFTGAAASSIAFVSQSCYIYRSKAGFLSHLNEQTMDIYKALDILNEQMKKEDLFSEYREALEFIAVKHILLRFRQAAWCSEKGQAGLKKSIVTDGFSYLSRNWPDWRANELVRTSLPDYLEKYLPVYGSQRNFLRYLALSEGMPDRIKRLLLGAPWPRR